MAYQIQIDFRDKETAQHYYVDFATKIAEPMRLLEIIKSD